MTAILITVTAETKWHKIRACLTAWSKHAEPLERLNWYLS